MFLKKASVRLAHCMFIIISKEFNFGFHIWLKAMIPFHLGIYGEDSIPWAFQAFEEERKKKPCLIMWIHSHVRGSECCFSSIDNHTQYAYSKYHSGVLGLVIEICQMAKKELQISLSCQKLERYQLKPVVEKLDASQQNNMNLAAIKNSINLQHKK